jgi:hypothetical protein
VQAVVVTGQMADNLKEKIDEAADKLDRLNGKLKTTLKEVRHWDMFFNLCSALYAMCCFSFGRAVWL